MKRVLMVAFHFPPLAAGSGIQRTLRFVQHLPSFGWQPIVLSVDPRVYERVGDDLLAEVPADVPVQRSFALDAARHLSIGGRYLGWTARPDRWVSWQWAAVRDGLRLIEKYRPDALWSTYPIATAHRIGARLQRRSGLPWVADFRDPMAQDGYPSDPAVWRSFAAIEAEAVARAACSVFTTPSAARTYRARYPDSADRISVLENGYDEESFAGLGGAGETLVPGRLTLLHSGVVYPSERDPGPLFAALERLLAAGRLPRDRLRLRFRATGHDDLIHGLVARHGVADVVEVCPPLPYREALDEMTRADGLLVMQAANCNEQIPAKLYEYLRAGRPILGLTDPVGDTAGALRAAGIDAIGRLDQVAEIEAVLPAFVDALAAGRAGLPQGEAVRRAARRERAAALAEILDRVSGPRAAA